MLGRFYIFNLANTIQANITLDCEHAKIRKIVLKVINLLAFNLLRDFYVGLSKGLFLFCYPLTDLLNIENIEYCIYNDETADSRLKITLKIE